MTFNTRTVSCDGAGCDADGLDPSDVSTIPLRLRPYKDPQPYLKPVEREIHLCRDRCLDGVIVSESSIAWIAFNQNEGSVEGVRHIIRSHVGDPNSYETWDERDSVVIGRMWEDLFEIVEDAIGEYDGLLPPRGGGQ